MTNTLGTARQPDDLYVGYLPLPPKYRVVVKVLAVMFIVLVGSASALIAESHRPAGPCVWEDDITTLTGRLSIDPYPVIVITDPDGKPRPVLLVNSGKHGAQDRLAALNGKSIVVKGTVLRRGNQMMLELDDDSGAVAAASADSGPQLPAVQSLGHMNLRGEILDSKCYLGAMKPGEGKTHKGCATLCIRGGVPPLLLTTDTTGTPRYYLIVNTQGKPMDEDLLNLVAEPVAVEGDAQSVAGMLQIRVSPEKVQRR